MIRFAEVLPQCCHLEALHVTRFALVSDVGEVVCSDVVPQLPSLKPAVLPRAECTLDQLVS